MSVAAGQTAPAGNHGLEDERGEAIIRVMITTSRALDAYLDDLERRRYAPSSRRNYARLLDQLCDWLPRDTDVSRITTDDLAGFLGQFRRTSPATQSNYEGIIVSFFAWLRKTKRITVNPAEDLARTRRIRPQDLDVTTVSTDDVRRMLFLAETWSERITLAILAYLGPRRHAVALLRLDDYDRARGRIRFREKGGKTIWKPIPPELDELIEAAIADGQYEDGSSYLVPPRRKLWKAGDRSDVIVYEIVKDVAARAGIEAHVHSLRAAFACFYLESHPGDVEALKELLGHRNLSTTETYLRRFNKEAAMERVRDLSWGVPLSGNRPPSGSSQISGKEVTKDALPLRSVVSLGIRKVGSQSDLAVTDNEGGAAE